MASSAKKCLIGVGVLLFLCAMVGLVVLFNTPSAVLHAALTAADAAMILGEHLSTGVWDRTPTRKPARRRKQ